MQPPENPNAFDYYAPENVSPLIAWLAEEDCPANSQVFHIGGNQLFSMKIAEIVHELETEGQWTPQELDRQLAGRLVQQTSIEDFFERMRPTRPHPPAPSPTV